MIISPAKQAVLLRLLTAASGTFETFGRDVRMSARGKTGHCGNIVVGPNLTSGLLCRTTLPSLNDVVEYARRQG
jgi:hypothetical protein